MPKTFTDEQVIEELRAIARNSTQSAVAKEIGVSEVYVSEILNGKRPVGPKVLQFLGYTRETVIRKIA